MPVVEMGHGDTGGVVASLHRTSRTVNPLSTMNYHGTGTQKAGQGADANNNNHDNNNHDNNNHNNNNNHDGPEFNPYDSPTDRRIAYPARRPSSARLQLTDNSANGPMRPFIYSVLDQT